MNGSRNDGKADVPLFDRDRMMRLFRGLRREAIDRAPPKVREAILQVVSSIEADERPDAEDLAVALMWTLDRRAYDLKRQRKKKGTRKKKPRRRWAPEPAAEPPPPPPSPAPPSPGQTAFGQRLDAQEEVRAHENSTVRRMTRRMGVKPSRVTTDAMGRRIQIQGDNQ